MSLQKFISNNSMSSNVGHSDIQPGVQPSGICIGVVDLAEDYMVEFSMFVVSAGEAGKFPSIFRFTTTNNDSGHVGDRW